MKNRSRFTIFTTILSVAACFGFAFGAAGPETPDPIGPVNSNTEDGFRALEGAGNGFNSAFGWFSLFFNGTAFFNTGCGAGTLFFNTAADNTAVGAAAMFFNTTGNDNTAVGINALRGDPVLGNSGVFNNAIGGFAMFSNSTGGANEAMGNGALFTNTTGSFNTAVGGGGALGGLLTGNDNTAIGWAAGSGLTLADTGNIDIGSGAFGIAGDVGVIRIGGLFSGANVCLLGTDGGGVGVGSIVVVVGGPLTVANVYGGVGTLNFMPGALIADAGATTDLGIDPASGQLAPLVSSARFKEDIKPMDKASDAIFALKPVTFRYKKELGGTEAPQFGLIAEEVAKVNPSLAGLDADGKPFSVNYRAVTAMLLNEFLKEHKKVEEQQASISQLKSEMQSMVAQLKEQAAQIQKVSAQLEVNKPAPQVVTNKP